MLCEKALHFIKRKLGYVYWAVLVDRSDACFETWAAVQSDRRPASSFHGPYRSKEKAEAAALDIEERRNASVLHAWCR